MTISVPGLSARVLVGRRQLDDLGAALQRNELVQSLVHRKRGREARTIVVPDPVLEQVHKKLHEFLTQSLPAPPSFVHGFVKGRSTLGNASPHTRKDVVLRMDLENFFPSISAEQVKQMFREHGFDDGAAELATRLTTFGGRLPIGFATSPVISNAVFRETDEKLAQFAESHKLTLTRYADDITISGAPTRETAHEVAQLLEHKGWAVNHAKTRLMTRGKPQYVTGLSVSDERPHTPRSFKRRLRFKLHIIERFGYETYWRDFGGEDNRDTPRKLLGYARYVAGIEPAYGGLLLRRFSLALEDEWSDGRSDDDWLGWLDGY